MVLYLTNSKVNSKANYQTQKQGLHKKVLVAHGKETAVTRQ